MFGPTANLIFAVLLTAVTGLWLSRRLSKRDWPLGAAFLLAVALSGFFGFRLVDRALYWADPDHLHQEPAPWMTVGYLARSWKMPPQELGRTLDLEPEDIRGNRLSDIAEETGIPVAELIDRLNQRLAQETLRDGRDRGATGQQ
ncbi:hypothetical protein [Paracoccus sp. SCSIO 75233]|uniref:hypothetical protein n=1 Tax=Paracoccus sp. SCSIO 75233 TaxID=3017782 RepID=UPI0022F07676|nr:hypothetical protein [Paracoccus sp. SCSIO 75233]WBU54687.1 hypothetical protein PAF12_07640 [Paracoccus sp. SCSIO 75233]